MTLEQIIIIFAGVAALLTVATITLLVVDAYRTSGRFSRRKKKEAPVKAHRPAPALRTPVAPVRKRRTYAVAPTRMSGRIPSGAFLGVIGGLLSGALVAAIPFMGKCRNCCNCYCCTAGRRCARRRGIRTYRF